MQRSNVAARAGRWSAQHRKAAILGLACIRGCGSGARRSGRHQAHPTGQQRGRRVGPGTAGAPRPVPAAGQRAGAGPEQDADGQRSGVPLGGRRRGGSVVRRKDGGERPLAAAAGKQRRDLQGRPLRARGLPDHRQGHGCRQARRRVACRDRRRTASASRPADRAGRRRELDQGPEQELQRRLRQGADPVAPDYPADPDRRLRRARGGRDPGAPRGHRRRGDPGVDRAGQPPRRGRPGRLRNGAADRDGRRRRLLALLHASRTRGTGRRTRRAGGPARGRGDVGPVGARLGPHGDRGDGRDVPGRQQDVRLDGHRHDHRRRGCRSWARSRCCRHCCPSSATR